MCKMKKKLQREDGEFIEIELERSYTYEKIIDVANKILKNDSFPLRLYRGVRILPEDLGPAQQV